MKRPLPLPDVSQQPFRPKLKPGESLVAWLGRTSHPAKRSKYNVDRSKDGIAARTVDGIVFASLAEARRYGELKLLEKGGHIRRLELQPVYTIEINGKHVCKVILDFRYFEGHECVVEDVKGRDNALSRLKRKLVESAYPGTKIRLVA